jgi:hypothetical protein
MTVRDIYAPVSTDITSYDEGQVYSFDFSYLEDSSIEVYEIIPVDGTDYRYLVPVQDYTIRVTAGRADIR